MKFLIKKYKKNQYYRPGESGVAIILLVISLVFFLIFFLIFIDVAYVYYIRGQLQNAADSGALAGAAKLKPGDCTVDQSGAGGAIEEATAFALKNTAAGGNVVVDPTDIIFGNWDRANNPPFTPCSTSLSVNAIQVNAKKTTNYLTGEFGLVFGKIFNMATMKVGAFAIAEGGGGAPTMPIPLCLPTVTGPEGQTDFASTACPGKKYIFTPAGVEHCESGGGNIWETYPPTLNPAEPNGNRIRDYLQNPQHINLCGKCIDTTQGNDFPLADIGPGGSDQGLEGLFADNKGDAIDKNGDPIVRSPSGETVQGWRVLVPILRPLVDCFGGAIGEGPGGKKCPGESDVLYKVVGMSDAIITQVDPPGPDSCPTCKPTGSPYEVGVTFIGTSPVSANVTQFRVLSCDDPDDVKEIDALAGRPRLVQ